MKNITFCAAPEAGVPGIITYLNKSGACFGAVSQTNHLTALAREITDTPGMVDDPDFSQRLKEMRVQMKGRYDHIFYVPIYGWNIIDDGRHVIDEDYRVRFDDNIQKLLVVSGLTYYICPEKPAWDRAAFVLDMVE